MTGKTPKSSASLPLPRRKRRKARPATQAEREAMLKPAVQFAFDWTDERWAEIWLPWIRMAVQLAGDDWERHKETWRQLVAAGEAPDMLEGLARTRHYLEALESIVAIALDRSFLAVELMGYSPDSPPPGTRMN